MSKPKAIVTRRWPEANEKRLREHFDVTFNESDTPFTADQLKDALKNCDVFMPTVTDKVTRDVLSVEGRTANMIANFGVGFNHIDIEAAKELGITQIKKMAQSKEAAVKVKEAKQKQEGCSKCGASC